MSYQELLDRRSTGLCFKCGQHYNPTNQCPDKHMRLLIWEGEDSNTEIPLAVEDQEDGGGWDMVCQVLDNRELDTPYRIQS